MKTRLWDGSLDEMGPCLSCGFDDTNYVCRSYVSGKNGIIKCDMCSFVKSSVWTDANGDRLIWNDSLNGKFNYCLGEVVHSKRHLSEILHKHDMMQKGDLVNNRDGRMSNVRDTGKAHTGRR